MNVYSWIRRKSVMTTTSQENNRNSESQPTEHGITKVTEVGANYWEAELYRPGEDAPFMNVRVNSLSNLFSRYSAKEKLADRI